MNALNGPLHLPENAETGNDTGNTGVLQLPHGVQQPTASKQSPHLTIPANPPPIHRTVGQVMSDRGTYDFYLIGEGIAGLTVIGIIVALILRRINLKKKDKATQGNINKINQDIIEKGGFLS